jgi:DNA-binding PadR family transcriptional regulator
MSPRALGHATLAVLNALADGHRYGFDIIDRTGLPSGTVYPALSRFERDGYVRSAWEDLQAAHDDKRPPRRYYRLTPQGRRVLDAALAQLREIGGTLARPAPARSRR